MPNIYKQEWYRDPKFLAGRKYYSMMIVMLVFSACQGAGRQHRVSSSLLCTNPHFVSVDYLPFNKGYTKGTLIRRTFTKEKSHVVFSSNYFPATDEFMISTFEIKNLPIGKPEVIAADLIEIQNNLASFTRQVVGFPRSIEFVLDDQSMKNLKKFGYYDDFIAKTPKNSTIFRDAGVDHDVLKSFAKKKHKRSAFGTVLKFINKTVQPGYVLSGYRVIKDGDKIRAKFLIAYPLTSP